MKTTIALLALLLTGVAHAGSASASFQVGLTIVAPPEVKVTRDSGQPVSTQIVKNVVYQPNLSKITVDDKHPMPTSGAMVVTVEY